MPAQRIRIKKGIINDGFATTFQEIQIRRHVVAKSIALSTLEPSDDKVENNSADGDGPIHHQRLWDAAETLARDLEPDGGRLHPTGRIRHGGRQLSAASHHVNNETPAFSSSKINCLYTLNRIFLK